MPGTNQKRTCKRIVLVAMVMMMTVPFQPAPASARNLLDMFFGGSRDDDYPRYEAPRRRYQQDYRYQQQDDGSVIEMPPRAPRNRGGVRAVTPRAPQPPAPPKSEPVAKLDDARKILVVGDFLAGGVGDELETAFETSPGVSVVARSDGSSGLVRDDHFNWLTELPGMIDEVKPAIVVVMLGANDRQQLTIGDDRQKFRSDGWFAEYEARIDKLAAIVTAKKLPLLWVGLPAFQSPSQTADAVTLNAMYRSEMEKTGGEFVDVWDGFVDEDGKFIVTGSDINGQQVRLRGSDGITFTKAGKRKLAFYVERFVRRHLGDVTSPDIVNLDAGSLSPVSTTPSPANPAFPTQPISLVDPNLDGGSELLGATPPPAVPAETPRDKLVKRGELPDAPAGRVDDYRMTR